MATVDLAARRAALSRSKLFQVLEPAELDAVLAQAATRRVPRTTAVIRRSAMVCRSTSTRGTTV